MTKAWSVVALLLGFAACSAPDPGAITFVDPPEGAERRTSGGGEGPSSSAASTTSDAGTGAGTTTGGTTGAAADPLFGATTFQAKPPTPADIRTVQGATHGALTGTTDCMTCHGAASTGTKLLFGGSVFDDAAGTTPAVNVEVWIASPDGATRLVANSDAAGYFFLRDPGPLPAGTLTGIRKNGKITKMISPISTGACNSTGCHGGALGVVNFQ
jgi:mono/diheme cytochrome c family protein